MESVNLSEIIGSYWDDMSLETPSLELALKLVNLIKDSMMLIDLNLLQFLF